MIVHKKAEIRTSDQTYLNQP